MRWWWRCVAWTDDATMAAAMLDEGRYGMLDEGMGCWTSSDAGRRYGMLDELGEEVWVWTQVQGCNTRSIPQFNTRGGSTGMADERR